MRLEPAEFDPVVGAAVAAGITVFDTARAYGEGERLLARALRAAGAATRARVVTKGGMARPNGAWVPDGRALAIRADCETSLAELDGLPIDLYLLHVPDSRTPWATSVRALARLAEEGLVRRVGLSNVNRRQLDEALELAPVAAVEVALSPFEDRALRGGVLDRCDELGLALIAHSPLGGPKRAGRTDAEEALAWLLGLSPAVVPIPGARRPETVAAAARSAAAAPAATSSRPRRSRVPMAGGAEVVLVMGVPGAGKSRLAGDYIRRGYTRLNRDQRGGSLRELAAELDAELASGGEEIVLDNTYLTRASRNDVIAAAARHGTGVHCVWLDTPLAKAQVNLVERLLDSFGALPSPDALREVARRGPGLLAPTSQMRAFRELEPPSLDEGFLSVERVEFEHAPGAGRRGVFVAAAAVDAGVLEADRDAPTLVFDWNPSGDRSVLDRAAARIESLATGPVERALCAHPGGPPICWCRPPLPGLPLAFARKQGVDPASSVVVGSSAAHRTLANAVGAEYLGA